MPPSRLSKLTWRTHFAFGHHVDVCLNVFVLSLRTYAGKNFLTFRLPLLQLVIEKKI
jgi:hypothetical protein